MINGPSMARTNAYLLGGTPAVKCSTKVHCFRQLNRYNGLAYPCVSHFHLETLRFRGLALEQEEKMWCNDFFEGLPVLICFPHLFVVWYSSPTDHYSGVGHEQHGRFSWPMNTVVDVVATKCGIFLLL